MQVDFKTKPLQQLDELALKIKAPERLGNKGNWFLMFRESQTGFLARLYGVSEHCFALHSWLGKPRTQVEHEYQISTIFFSMDSALECFVFMLNSFGYGCIGTPFRRTDNSSELRQARVQDLIGIPHSTHPKKSAIASYGTLFPVTQKLWIAKYQLILSIQEQHDVSKHRRAIFEGGRHKTVAPDGFFEQLGLSPESPEASVYWPMEKTILSEHPKLHGSLTDGPIEGATIYLEAIVEEFQQLVNNSMNSALMDASNCIRSLRI